MNSGAPEEKTIGALNRSFAIVEYLRTNGESRLTNISSALDTPKSTIYVHLQTLIKHDFVTKEGSKYNLGLRFIGFGEQAKRKKDEYDIVEQGVEKLAGETGERALFIVEEHGSGYYVHIKLGENGIDLGRGPGAIGKQFHASSAGKIILAFTEPEERQSLFDSIEFDKVTSRTVTSREDVMKELDQVRERGYAVNHGELLHGLYGISVPIMYPDSRLLGALTVSGPEHRIKSSGSDNELKELMLGVANEIELKISQNQSFDIG